MKWIVSNHKNELDEKQISKYIEQLNNISKNDINLVVCPKDDHLKYFDGTNYEIGSQDINLSFDMMKELNIKYCIIGHSDFRKKNHETNEQINKKIKDLISNDIMPILCIGEEENNINIKQTLKNELSEGLNGINSSIIIAYEPIWAIGSGKIPDISILTDIINFINVEATSILGRKPIVLYGGSVNEKTVEELEKVYELDGYLIGKASLDVEKIEKLIEVVI